MSRPRWWLLSAYRADSHARWADWLVDTFSAWTWDRLELPGRHFRWRIRGNPLSWLDQLPPESPAGVVATSMVDWATLRGLHPRLAGVPCLYYFHENQFAYPVSGAQFRSIDPQMVQLYGALAADRVLFNSAWNRDSFLAGVDALMARLPDAVPDGLRQRLAARAGVCPVPIPPPGQATGPRDPRLVLWNHRWDYDKAPELFAEAMLRLAAQGVEFRLALLGPRPARTPPALARLRRQLGPRIVTDAYLGAGEYQQLLGRAGLAVSTAIHEFQGLAMLEAVAAGVRPLVPDALCYPEQYPAGYRYPPGDVDALASRVRDWLNAAPDLPRPDLSAWQPTVLRGQWQAELDRLLGGG